MTTLELQDHGKTLATRPLAADLRSGLEREVAAGDRVVLDFAGIKAISQSFADELVASLAQSALTTEGEVCVINASDDVQRVILRATEARQAGSKLCLAAPA